jgi:hypothetical protein
MAKKNLEAPNAENISQQMMDWLFAKSRSTQASSLWSGSGAHSKERRFVI